MYCISINKNNLYEYRSCRSFCHKNSWDTIKLKAGVNFFKSAFSCQHTGDDGFVIYKTIDIIYTIGAYYAYDDNKDNKDYFKFVIIPDDAVVKKKEKNVWMMCDGFYVDKIIINDCKYAIYDIDTILKFNINIIEKNGNVLQQYINCLANNGSIRGFEWLKKCGFNLEGSDNCLDHASKNNHINILQWWLNSGIKLELRYFRALLFASEYGNLNVLEWWKNSGLKLIYDESSLNFASRNGHINVLNWWLNSGLELKYSKNALKYASEYGQVAVLEWWKNSGLKLIYDESVLHYAFETKNYIVIDWWHQSGLQLKYSSYNILYHIFLVGDIESLKIYKKIGLPFDSFPNIHSNILDLIVKNL